MSYSRRYDQALIYAHELHREQIRKGSKVPYISHLLSVSALVCEAGEGEDVAIAALLHDAAEDQGGEKTLATIRERFGDVVADIVAACSDTFEDPKPPWRARKERYIAHLSTASAGARAVSCADKLHNARSIVAELRSQGPKTWEKFAGKRDGSLWYYRSIVAALKNHGAPSGLLDELARCVDTLHELAG